MQEKIEDITQLLKGAGERELELIHAFVLSILK